MKLSELLEEDDFLLGVPSREKRSALEAVASRLGRRTGRPQGEVLNALLRRERLGSTATGDGLAMPHATLAGISVPANWVRDRRDHRDLKGDGETLARHRSARTPGRKVLELRRTLRPDSRVFVLNGVPPGTERRLAQARLTPVVNTLGEETVARPRAGTHQRLWTQQATRLRATVRSFRESKG